MAKPETIIVNEINWTPTARMADIVLPITTSYERNDLTMSGDYSMMHILPMKQVVEPQFEARNDYDVFAELAKRAGVEDKFTEGKSEMDWLKYFYQSALMPHAKIVSSCLNLKNSGKKINLLHLMPVKKQKNGFVMVNSVKIHY